MAKPYDTRLIMLVAQQPFDVEFNKFCKLVPLLFADGVKARAAEFPNDGEIWWMLTHTTTPLGSPGHLVTGFVHDATQYDPDKDESSAFQVIRDDIRELGVRDGAEVLEVPNDSLATIEDLVAGSFVLRASSRPTPYVLIRWRESVHGLFQTASELVSSFPPLHHITLQPHNPDASVIRMADQAFRNLTQKTRFSFSEDVSGSPTRRMLSPDLFQVRKEIVLGEGVSAFLARGEERLVLEPLERKLMGLAKQYLTRKKRQEFRALLAELELGALEGRANEDVLASLRQLELRTDEQERALVETARAILESGVLGEDRLREAEERVAHRYLEDRTAELQAEIDQRIGGLRDEIGRLEAAQSHLEAQLSQETAAAREKVQLELNKKRIAFEAELAQARERLVEEERELARQREVVQGHLQEVTKELREAGDQVVNRFLTLAPLLQLTGHSGINEPKAGTSATREESSVGSERPSLAVPQFLLRPESSRECGITESHFFDRFEKVVSESGFSYRDIDLRRFHLSVKCGPLTVLGGPSGTGKSSLPRLYANALVGEEAGTERPSCLMVSVNPSWMEARDLMGHFNSLERRFFPAESGLFQLLVYAQEEFRARNRGSGIYTICLDEMNLAQVEHYFSDFLGGIDREGSQWRVHCFPTEVASGDCPFRNWGTIEVSPATRFIGTVNFDETTRLLSDRVLDRLNLVNLGPGFLPETGTGSTEGLATADGPRVSLADFDLWRNDTALPREIAPLIDTLRPILLRLGCPISPRTYRAIRLFVGSAKPLIHPSTAFDIQLAQRVVPRIRPPTSMAGSDALDKLLRTLNDSTLSHFEETVSLLEQTREDLQFGSWDLED